MTFLAITLCSFFFAAARGDTFSINNPDALRVSIRDENNRLLYWSTDVFATFETLFATHYVSVIAQDTHNHKAVFNKEFATSLVEGPVCNYALMLTAFDGHAYWKSLQSAEGCTSDVNNYNSQPSQQANYEFACVIFDNTSPHKVYPAFGSENELSSDKVNDFLAPAAIRAYCTQDAYMTNPALEKAENIGVFDPWFQHYMPCGMDVVLSGTTSYVYQTSVEGDFVCNIKNVVATADAWLNNKLYYAGDEVAHNDKIWEATDMSYDVEPSDKSHTQWKFVSPGTNSVASVVTSPDSAVETVVVDVFAALGLLTVIYGSYNFFCGGDGK